MIKKGKKMMKTTCEQQQSWLLKRFHTLCTKTGINPDEKAAIIAGFGVGSSRDLTLEQLQMACDALDKRINPELAQLDKWRKRVIASINGYLAITSQDKSIARIKAIACRATDKHDFNEIPKDRLINVYYSFLKKQQDFKRVSGIVTQDLETLSAMN
jgi:hypothetical protein